MDAVACAHRKLPDRSPPNPRRSRLLQGLRQAAVRLWRNGVFARQGSSALDKLAKATHGYERRPSDLNSLQVPGANKLVKLGPANADHSAGLANANRKQRSRVDRRHGVGIAEALAEQRSLFRRNSVVSEGGAK